MKRVAVLGSTGSIGAQALDVVSRHPERLRIVSLAASSQEGLLREQAQRFGVKNLALANPRGAPEGISVGEEALIDQAVHADVDLVVMAIVGSAGLRATIAALQAGKQVALASKEVLVAAGELVMPMTGGSILGRNPRLTPIDSEHSAIWQCLQGYEASQVDSLILTASGGPFRGRKKADLEAVTVRQALNHPTWNMGGKITIDSATLMNKALEMIEAKWLFGLEMDQVEVVVHPQSILHSGARLTDGSVLGQMGWPDMRLPIQLAMLHPDRPESGLKRWSPLDSPTLTFEALDESTFRGPALAREAVRKGGTSCCALNAANEIAVEAFLQGKIGFLEIYRVVETVLERHQPLEPSLENVLGTDAETRRLALSVVEA